MRRLNKEVLSDNLTRRIEEDRAAARVGGVVLAVWQDGEEVFARGFGGVGEHTMFRLASMTKPVTAVATLVAVERGLLSLDDPLANDCPKAHLVGAGRMAHIFG